MKIKTFLLGVFVGIFTYGCCNSLPDPYPAPKLPEIELYKSVIKLKIETLNEAAALVSTGFAVDNKYIITAGHFCTPQVEGPLLGKWKSEMEMVYLNNNGELAKSSGVEIVAIDLDNDLCLLKKKKHGIIPVKIISDYSKINIGDDVKIIGAPLGFFPHYTSGKVVTSKTQIDKNSIYNKRLVISVPSAGGNSGSPVFNSKMEVIGVVIAVSSSYSHITLAVCSDDLKRFLKKESGK